VQHMKEGALLTDFSSLKEREVAAMDSASCETLGMHPLFGPQAPSLREQNIVFSRTPNSGRYTAYLEDVFRDAGACVVDMTPEEHDRHMAYIQVLVHASNIVLGKTIADAFETINTKLVTPGFRLQAIAMGRYLSADPKLFAQIAVLNSRAVEVLDALEENLSTLKNAIATKDTKGYEDMFVMVRDVLGELIAPPVAEAARMRGVEEERESNG
jgi:prephenate dehydrogenase